MPVHVGSIRSPRVDPVPTESPRPASRVEPPALKQGTAEGVSREARELLQEEGRALAARRIQSAFRGYRSRRQLLTTPRPAPAPAPETAYSDDESADDDDYATIPTRTSSLVQTRGPAEQRPQVRKNDRHVIVRQELNMFKVHKLHEIRSQRNLMWDAVFLYAPWFSLMVRVAVYGWRSGTLD